MTITHRVQSDVAAAAKAREDRRLAALRLLLDALKKEAKDARADLDEKGEIAVLKRERKRRLEAAEAYREANREERAQSEEAEARIIEEYLPEQLSDNEIEAIVSEAVDETGAQSAREVGTVMAIAMRRVGDRADGARVSAVVRERLS